MASLERLWKEGRDGALSPLEQMRAWALRTAQRDLGGDKAVNRRPRSLPGSKIGLQCSERGRSGYLRT